MTMTEPQPSAEPSAEPTSELRRSVSAAAERIEEILGAAEGIGDDLRREAEADAERIRKDAHAEAGRYKDASRREADRVTEEQVSRLETVLEALRSQLRSIEEQGSKMVGAVEEAIERVRAGSRAQESPSEVRLQAAVRPRSPSSAPHASPTSAPAPSDEKRAAPAIRTADDGEKNGQDSSQQAAMIRATQLAVGGSDRAEIEDTLRREFGLDDPGTIAGEILGTG
jgi:cell division septum initiation protein DivIVA